MNKVKANQLYKKAIILWGYPLQLGMLIEECAELIQATNKVLRNGDSQIDSKSKEFENFIEEIADVEIMLEQIRYMFSWNLLSARVETAKKKKLLRLEEMINQFEQ